MSHQVTVDFEGVSTTIQIKCNQATQALCKIDKTLENIRKNANKIETKKMREYEEYLIDSKNKIQTQIDEIVLKLEKYKMMKRTVLNYDTINEWDELNNVIRMTANQLVETVNQLTGPKLSVIDELVNEGLLEFIDKTTEKMIDTINGVTNYDPVLVEQLNAIEDISLRDLAFQELYKGNSSFEDIIINSQAEYNRLLQGSSFIKDVQRDLEIAGIPQEEISEIIDKPINISTVTQIQEEAYSKIVDESIRKEVLKVIIKSIRDRGFIVDTRKNIKIDRKNNIVKLVAKKPDGKIAEFEISLNGKFMYHFDGYEGLACNQDITPFLDDLKNIYDINILHEEIHWSNPDKIQTQKYQYMNTNKNRK